MAGVVMRPSFHASERQAAALPASAPVPAVLPAPSPARRQGVFCAKRVVSSPHSPVLAAAAAVAERPTVSFAQQTPEAVAKENVATQKPTVIITGASSGLGLSAARALAQTGDWHVVMACRDFSKAQQAAKREGLPNGSFTVLHLDLASLESVRQFVDAFRATGRRLDALVCNAAVYLPTAKEPRFTADGFELSAGVNHLSHFLLANLLLEDLQKSPGGKPRCVIVGSVTGNTNTVAGNVPPKANLGDLSGLNAGLGPDTTAMIDGAGFDGAKAYKDAKLCNMLTMQELHRRFHDTTGITFASLYPGCIAETGLFREHYGLFRALFPPFQKYITKGYVSEKDAGDRLAQVRHGIAKMCQVVADEKLAKSGVYWSWNDNSSSFENQLSGEASDAAKAAKLWEVSERLVGLAN